MIQGLSEAVKFMFRNFDSGETSPVCLCTTVSATPHVCHPKPVLLVLLWRFHYTEFPSGTNGKGPSWTPGQTALLVAQTVKNLPAVQKTWVKSWSWEDPLQKGMATNSMGRAPWWSTVHRLPKSRIQLKCLSPRKWLRWKIWFIPKKNYYCGWKFFFELRSE